MTRQFLPALIVALLLILGCSAARCPRMNDSGYKLFTSTLKYAPSPRSGPNDSTIVGYGHVCLLPGCRDVPFRIPLSKAHAGSLLKQGIRAASLCLDKCLDQSVQLNDNQWSALLSWVQSVGCEATVGSSMIEKLNRKENPNAVFKSQIKAWFKNNTQDNDMWERRKLERVLFLTRKGPKTNSSC